LRKSPEKTGVKLCIVFYLLLFSLSSFAQPDTLFGPEFTATSFKYFLAQRDWLPEIQGQSWSQHIEKEKFREISYHLKKICADLGCEVDNSLIIIGEIEVELADGTKITFETDYNVIEASIEHKNMSIAYMEKNHQVFDEVIFKTFKSSNLEPTVIGSGHITIDIESAFGNDLRHVRNFFANHINHPAVWFSVLESDSANALHLALATESEQLKFKQVMDLMDQKIKAGDFRLTPEIMLLLEEATYDKSLEFHKEGNIEVRALRAQKNMRQFIDQCKMLDLEIEYTKKISSQGIFIGWDFDVGFNGPRQVKSQFYHYITSIGGDWNYYKKFLNPLYKLIPLVKDRAFAYQKFNFCSKQVMRTRAVVHKKIYQFDMKVHKNNQTDR